VLLCGCFFAVEAQFPDLSRYSVVFVGTTNFGCSRSGDAAGMSKTEVPPWTIGGGNGYRSYFLTDGENSGVFSTKLSLADNAAIDPAQGIGPYWTSFSGIKMAGGGCPIKDYQPWRRDYYSIYSAQYLSLAQPVSLAFLHAENKDLCMGGRDCHSDVNAGPDTCFDGDLWSRYNAMVCASWVANDQQSNWGQHYFSNDMGPIAWPSTGYLQPNGIKASCGIGIPSSIVYNGYVYVFYLDHGPYAGLNPLFEEGRLGGIKLVRAPVNAALDPAAYMAYYRDTAGNDVWAPSLPAGFTKETMLNFLSTRGPKTTDLMGEEPRTSAALRFSVAAVRNTNYFIGVESYSDLKDGGRYKTALRWSSDLLHWTPRMLVISNAAGFDSSTMNYPVFLSKDGLSNTVVDSSDFYVLGTHPGKGVNSIVYKLHVTAPDNAVMGAVTSAAGIFPAPLQDVSCFPNPCTGICTLAIGNVAGDVHVDVFDITGRHVGGTQWSGLPARPISQSLDLSAYAAGLYVIRVQNNGAVYTIKVVRK
jgi:hypothetical protein